MEKFEINDLQDFPMFSEKDLQEFTFGSYQIKNAKSYSAEQLEGGDFFLMHAKAWINVFRFRIQSRHVSSKRYDLYIEIVDEGEGISRICAWYCKCASGARTFGCCSHVASILWFLGYGRHVGFSKPSEFLNGLFEDTRVILKVQNN